MMVDLQLSTPQSPAEGFSDPEDNALAETTYGLLETECGVTPTASSRAGLRPFITANVSVTRGIVDDRGHRPCDTGEQDDVASRSSIARTPNEWKAARS
jgi:hypothetical protein